MRSSAMSRRAIRVCLALGSVLGGGSSPLFAQPTARASSIVRAIDSVASDAFSAGIAGGVVVVAGRSGLEYRRAFGTANIELSVPMRPDHVFNIGSITKQFTAVAILQLVAQGRVALDEDVRTYVPTIQTHGRRLTVEQVLTHTSGLPNLVDLPEFETLARQDHTTAQLLELTRNVPLHFEPGTSFRYSDTGYILLGSIIEHVSGLSYADYVEQRIFKPLDMRNSYYGDDVRILRNRAAGYTVSNGAPVNAAYISMTVPQGAGGLASTADDLLTWHVALRKGAVIADTLLARAWRPRVLPGGVTSGYGFGFKVCTLGDRRTVGHGGFINGFSAASLYVADDSLDVIVLVNNDGDAPDAGGLARRIARFVSSGRALPSYVSLTPSQRRVLIGRYLIAAGDVREILERDGKLFSKRNGGSEQRLEALTPTTLTLAASEGAFVMTFEVGSAEQAMKIHTTLSCEPVDIATRVAAP